MITLIIPTYRNAPYAELAVRSAVENKKDESTEIIVVVDGYAEETIPAIQKYPNVYHLVLQENRGMQNAINMGVMKATNPIVFIANDDNVFPTDWDVRLENVVVPMLTANDRQVLTVNQIEPVGPGMFNFPVVDLGRDWNSFDYQRFLAIEKIYSSHKVTHDGHIFPFVLLKKYYMAINGLDTFFNSPNVCDWDFFMRLEMLGFEFPRIHELHLYHFGSVATKKNAEREVFMTREAQAIQEFEWKWGFSPYNEPGTNKKFPPMDVPGITNWPQGVIEIDEGDIPDEDPVIDHEINLDVPVKNVF